MKHLTHILRLSGAGALLALSFTVTVARAELPAIPADEKIIFSEDFTDNKNGWTNVVTPDNAAASKAVIVNSAWGPSIPKTKLVGSRHTFDRQPSLSEGPITIYLSARVDDIAGQDSGRFGIQMTEAAGNKMIGLGIRPGNAWFFSYRDKGGAGQTVFMPGTAKLFKDTQNYHQFKITVTAPAGGISPATAEVFYYDAAASQYVSLHSAGGAVALDTGEFGRIDINCINAEAGGAYFDSIVITQTRP
jgi:hypothetical protein